MTVVIFSVGRYSRTNPPSNWRFRQHYLQFLTGDIPVTGCGRTDTGVHATTYFAHFDFDGDLPEEFIYKLNCVLPESVVVYDLYEVDDEAHARFHAVYREYHYYLHIHKNPFLQKKSGYYPNAQLDGEKIAEAISLLPDYTDFKPLSKNNEDIKTTDCEIFDANWNYLEENGQYLFSIAANRFLRSMVRRIVGTLVSIGKGKTSIEEFKSVMEERGEFNITDTAPPDGLYLVDVRYPFMDD